jgi:hypothetical protein
MRIKQLGQITQDENASRNRPLKTTSLDLSVKNTIPMDLDYTRKFQVGRDLHSIVVKKFPYNF